MPWVGAKSVFARDILGMFPLTVERYIEVFGGSAAILLAKEVSKFEVLLPTKWQTRISNTAGVYGRQRA